MDYSNYTFFKKALEGENYVSEPLSYQDGGDMIMVVSAPLRKNGDTNNIVGAVIFALSGQFLSDSVKDIQVGEKGTTYIIDKNGNTMAHPNYELVKKKCNTIDDAKTDETQKEIAKMEQNMIDANLGFG